MIAALTVSVMALVGLFYLAAVAPLGWQDENGWHEGIEPLEHSDYSGE